MRIQIRMAKTTECKMLPMAHLCCLKGQAFDNYLYAHVLSALSAWK